MDTEGGVVIDAAASSASVLEAGTAGATSVYVIDAVLQPSAFVPGGSQTETEEPPMAEPVPEGTEVQTNSAASVAASAAAVVAGLLATALLA